MAGTASRHDDRGEDGRKIPGFARDQHDEAAEYLSNAVAVGNQTLASTIKLGPEERSLNRANVGPDILVRNASAHDVQAKLLRLEQNGLVLES